MFQLWMEVVGLTATVFTIISTIATENTRKRFSDVLVGHSDLEVSSSRSVEGIIGDAFKLDSEQGIRRLTIGYFAIVFVILFVLRIGYKAPDFYADDIGSELGIYLTLLVLLLGALWFTLSILVGRFTISRIGKVSDVVQIGLGFALLLIVHAIVANVMWAADQLNIGVSHIIDLPESYGFSTYNFASWGVLRFDSGLDQLLFAEYLAAFAIPFLFWSQVVLGHVTRSISDKPTPDGDPTTSNNSGEAIKSRQRLIRFLFGWWANADEHPFLVAAMLVITIETWGFIAVQIVRSLGGMIPT